MTSGQVDPGRLHGEALRRWYMRTSAENEAERAAAAGQAYNVFFSQPRSGAPPNFGNGAQGAIARAPKDFRSDGNSATASPDPGAHAVQMAATAPGFWDHWSPRSCANCHGYTPGTLPPVGGQSPFPPSYSPRSGGAGGRGGSQPDRGDKKECDLQHESDSQVCGRLRAPNDVAICRQSASERYAHCLKPNGTIGFPDLETRGGRRRSCLRLLAVQRGKIRTGWYFIPVS